MEQKQQTDSNLKGMLNSPLKSSTPSIPSPDWSSPSSSQTVSSGKSSDSIMTVAIPGSAVPGDPHTNITLHNCVCTLDLNTLLNLETLNARTRNSEYNPRKFHGVVMRLREPRTTALIFRSGKIVCTGSRSEQEALLACKKYARIIQKIGFEIRATNFKIQNIVATCDLRFPIKLENLNMMHGQFSSYEPELFPALIYRLIKPKLVILVFVNGKLVFTGAKSRQEIKEALDNIYPVLKSFKKN